MIGPGSRTRVFAYGSPCDMRKGFNTLTGLVGSMGREVTTGDVFLFSAANRKRAKVLWYDGTGLCLLSKRPDSGRFARRWGDSVEVTLSMSELRLFLGGCDLVGRGPLSPPVIDVEKASRVSSADFC